MSYIHEHWRLFGDSMYQKLLILAHIFEVIFENVIGFGFLTHRVG